MRGQLFCSTACARDSGRHVVWRRARRELLRPVPARLAVIAVALGAGAPVILALRTVADLDRLNQPSAFSRPRREAPSARLESVAETERGFRLEGSAPAGTAVFLFARGRFVAAAPAALGRFRFDGIRERGPFRVGAMPLSAELSETSAQPLSPTLPAVAEPQRPTAPEAQKPAARRILPPVAHPPRPIAFAPPRERPAVAPPPAVSGGFPAPDLTRGPSDRPDVLVSFDAGSSDRGALEILDAMRARGIRTTIFVTGEFIRGHPEIVRRIAQDGHEVGNHTDSHPHLTTYASDGRQATRPGVDRAYVAGELGRTERLFREATGRSLAPIWRAPFGEHNAEIRRWAAEQGYWHVGWTGGRTGLDGLDWISNPRSRGYQPAERLLGRLVVHAENGGIVLLHLGSDRDEPVASRIGLLFDGLKDRGFRLARASELLARSGYDETRLAAFRRPSASTAR